MITCWSRLSLGVVEGIMLGPLFGRQLGVDVGVIDVGVQSKGLLLVDQWVMQTCRRSQYFHYIVKYGIWLALKGSARMT
jgi:hypothetical protein